MARPKVHDDALRATLLVRAATLVSIQGPDALSLRRLAGEAGTSTTAIYSLFGGKAGLLEQLYREAVSRFARALREVDLCGDPATDIVRIGVAYRRYALADPHLYEVMFNPNWSQRGSLAKEQARTFQPLLETVRRSQEAGQLVNGPPERIALACWAIVHGLVVLELSGKVPNGLQVSDHYLDALHATVEGWRAPRADAGTADPDTRTDPAPNEPA